MTGTEGRAIETSGITMRFGEVEALTSLDIAVGDGVTGLVGANCAGKSTLIKILLGLLEPTSGQASVLGHDIAEESAEIRRLVGYMPEHDCLPPDVSASDFVVHMGRMSGPQPVVRAHRRRIGALARRRADQTLAASVC